MFLAGYVAHAQCPIGKKPLPAASTHKDALQWFLSVSFWTALTRLLCKGDLRWAWQVGVRISIPWVSIRCWLRHAKMDVGCRGSKSSQVAKIGLLIGAQSERDKPVLGQLRTEQGTTGRSSWERFCDTLPRNGWNLRRAKV